MITSKTKKLDLHGEISSIAKVLINDFIKTNYLLNEECVIIVHGKGTYVLQHTTHDVLKVSPYVEKFYLNSWNLGETVVELKKNSREKYDRKN